MKPPGVSVADLRGKTITLEKPANRIVCLIESALSGLYMLGAGQRVVGVSTSAYQEGTVNYYQRLDSRIRDKTLPTPGNWDFINIEKVIALKPDLVIIWAHQEEAIRALEERGVPVFGVFIKSFDDVFEEMRALGVLTGTEARASALVEYTRNELRLLGEKISAKSKPVSVYFMWSQGELETSGRPSTVQELITLAGGENVAGSIDQEHVVVNIEKILKWDPEVIVMWPNARRGPSDIVSNPVWKNVEAVRNSRVYQLPDMFSCDLWTLKYQFAVRLMAKWLYPDLFQGVDPDADRAEVFDELYSASIAVSHNQ
ncbi:MAG: ABC transporter substrate-binding protein [Syntrophobacteraceae bacterium]